MPLPGQTGGGSFILENKMKASYYVLLCAIAVLAGCVNKQVVKAPDAGVPALHIENACLTGKTSSDKNYFYVGITLACAEGIPSATIGADRYLPVKKSTVSRYQYTDSGLTISITPGNDFTSVACPADTCDKVSVNNQVCLCDKYSAIFLSRADQAANKVPYTSCMCTAALDRQIAEAAKAAMPKKVSAKKASKPVSKAKVK